MYLFLDNEYKPQNVVGDVPGGVEEEGYREGFRSGDAEDGEEVNEKELVDADVPRRRGHREAHVEEGRDKRGVDKGQRNTEGLEGEVQG